MMNMRQVGAHLVPLVTQSKGEAGATLEEECAIRMLSGTTLPQKKKKKKHTSEVNGTGGGHIYRLSLKHWEMKHLKERQKPLLHHIELNIII